MLYHSTDRAFLTSDLHMLYFHISPYLLIFLKSQLIYSWTHPVGSSEVDPLAQKFWLVEVLPSTFVVQAYGQVPV